MRETWFLSSNEIFYCCWGWTCARCAPNKSKKEKKNLIYPLKYQVVYKVLDGQCNFFFAISFNKSTPKRHEREKIQDNNVAEKCWWNMPKKKNI